MRVTKAALLCRRALLVADHQLLGPHRRSRKRAFDVVLVARGDAEAGDVHQQVLAFARGRRRLSTPAALSATILSASVSATDVFGSSQVMMAR